MNLDEVVQLKKSLTKAITEGNTSTILDIMNQLNNEVVPTKELLKKTEIGVFIGKQRQHNNAAIAKLAKEIVKKWRTAVQTDSPRPTTSSKTSTNVTNAITNSIKVINAASITDDANVINDANTTDASDEGFAKPRPVHRPGPGPSSKPTLSRENSLGDISSPSPNKRENSFSDSSSPNTPSTPKTDNDRQSSGDRTYKKDNIKYTTGDSTRDKCIELIFDSLAFDSNADSDTILNRAIKIEQIVLDQFRGEPDKQYRDKLRGMISNLKDKKNPGLRKGVVSGEIPAQKFCTMSKGDMASEEKKARDREIQQQNLFKARGAGPTQAETDMFRCGKCGKRKTTYYQMQTRSADEPMTTFVTCTVCNNRWKFC